MRNLKFVLSALAILLAGALAAGFAARAVAAPRAGEVVNAGVLPVPSVLGQTADEALFYPWSLYEMQTLSPIPNELLESPAIGNILESVAAFEVFGVECDIEKLVSGQLWNNGESTVFKGSSLVFVKDFPAALADGGAPVSLDYALSDMNPLSVSWLVRPQAEEELTEAQRQAALDKVREDLADLLRRMNGGGGDDENDLMRLIEDFGRWFDETNMNIFRDRLESLINVLYTQYSVSVERAAFDESGRLVEETFVPIGPERDLSSLSLEELLALRNGEDVNVQLITTSRQVVILFSRRDQWTSGVYYDVQLERYSGLGLS